MNILNNRPSKDHPSDMVKIGNLTIPRKWIWQGKFKKAIWSFSSGFSLILNFILIGLIIVLGRELFTLKKIVEDGVVGGLYYNFILMDQATISTTIEVQDNIPVQFDLLINQETTVILTQPTSVQGATVTLSTGGLNIVQAPTNIILPAGTKLPIKLDMVVPVNTTIPITLTVPVNIPLNQTELHIPFVGLQKVMAPFYDLLNNLPDSWGEFFTGK